MENRPLTLGELSTHEMPCALWLERRDKQEATLEIVEDCGPVVTHLRGFGMWTDEYNKDWRMWACRPTGIKIAANPWPAQ